MRITTQHSVILCMACGLLSVVLPPTSFANEPKGAHAMAHQFANAHKPKPTKTKSKNAIEPKQVEGAFEVRSQENELKTTDQILESIEARTRAIEALLEESTSDKWNVYVGKPANVVVDRSARPKATPTEIATDSSSLVPAPTAKLDFESQVDTSTDRALAEPVLSEPTAANTATHKTADRANWAATTNPATSSATDNAPENELSETHALKLIATPEQRKDVTELPEPGYALGGPGNLRHGLAEASSILSTATVLLKLKPGNTGLRRFKKTADPVLCGRRHCYMSKGFQEKAYRMLRGTTLGPFNTLGRRAGACRQKLTCVFRNVDLMDDGVLLQPVDLKFMRHDRRAYRNIKADQSCALSGGRLHCANPIKAKTWTAWIVPEHIALEAGSDALETALQDGLPETPIPSIHVNRTEP